MAVGLDMSFRLQLFVGRLSQSAFVRNVLVVVSGTAVAQIIGFALSPVISRLFSASDFGVFGSFGAVLAVITAGVTLEYSQAIMLPTDKGDAMNLFVVSCLAMALITAACLVACLIAPATVHGLVKVRGGWMLALLVAATVSAGLNQACQAWCVRVKAFKHTSASQVVRSVASNGMQIGLGSVNAGGTGLIVSSVLADVLASVNLGRVLLQDLLALRQTIRWKRMQQLMKEYRDFPTYSASQNVINALSVGLPIFLLTHFYGIGVAGSYAFGGRILQAPMNLVLRALRQVLFQKAGETQHQGNPLFPLYVKSTVGLVAVALLPALVLVVCAPPLFVWVFGAKWQTAGEFARYLVVWLLTAFSSLPADLFARLIRIQRTIFFCDLLKLAARALVLAVGGLCLTALQSVILFSVVGAVMNAAVILLVGHAVAKRERERQRGDILVEDYPILAPMPADEK